jgi:hypothetical protein
MNEAPTLDVSSDALFARHLNLAPLGGRRRGLVPCRFHAERTASLSVDLDRGIFHCFGCGAQGGVKRFAERVGEGARTPARPTHYRSPLDEARAAILLQARRQPWNGVDVLHNREMAGWVRFGHRRVLELRAAGHERVDWDCLANAARIETAVHALEHSLDTSR